MDARVIFSRETRQKLNNPALSEKAKRRLRIERVMQFIDSQPAGAIRHIHVLQATGFDPKSPNEYQRAKTLVDAMIRDGLIDHDGEQYSRSAHYKVKKTTLEATRQAYRKGYSLEQLEKDAIAFFWETGNDSLRAFVQHKVSSQEHREK